MVDLTEGVNVGIASASDLVCTTRGESHSHIEAECWT